MPRNTILNVLHARKCRYTCRSICWTEDQECSESLPQPPFQVAVALSTAQAPPVMPAPGEHHHSGQLDSIQKDPSFVNLGADGPSISAKPGQKVRADLHSSLPPFPVWSMFFLPQISLRRQMLWCGVNYIWREWLLMSMHHMYGHVCV
jgi:hypothetical protein